MAKLWAIIRREYLERVRTKWFVVGTLMGPILFGTMLFLPAVLAKRSSGSVQASNIIVIDATGLGAGARVADAIELAVRERAGAEAVPKPEVRVVAAEAVARAESLATAEVVSKRRQGFLVLDTATVRGDSARYAGRNATSVNEIERVRTAMRQAILGMELERNGMNPARVDSLTKRRIAMPAERITERGKSGNAVGNLLFATMTSFLLYMAIVLYGQAVLRGVLEEKMTRVAEVVVSSVRPTTLLAGKVMGVGAVGLTQMAIWILATGYLGSFMGSYLSRSSGGDRAISGATAGAAFANMPEVSFIGLGLIVLFFLLGYTFYSSLYAAMGSTVNSEQEAQQALMPVFVLIISSALLIQPVLLNPGSSLARVASIVPFSAPIIMPLRMSLVPVPPWEIGATVALLILACVGAIWLAARIYRVGLLMYGKRPSFGEIARWVRAG